MTILNPVFSDSSLGHTGKPAMGPQGLASAGFSILSKELSRTVIKTKVMFGFIQNLFASVGILLASIFGVSQTNQVVDTPIFTPATVIEESPTTSSTIKPTPPAHKPTPEATPDSTPISTPTPSPTVTPTSISTPTPSPTVTPTPIPTPTVSQERQNYLWSLFQAELARINHEIQWNEDILKKISEITSQILPLENELSKLEMEQEQAIEAVYERSLNGAVLRGAIESEVYNIRTGNTRESYERLKRIRELTNKILQERRTIFTYQSQLYNNPPASRYSCDDFYNWEEAKFVYSLYNGDPFDLDRDNDGVPCEELL